MVKRIISVLLVLAMLVPSLCACGGADSGKNPSTQATDSNQESANGTADHTEYDIDVTVEADLGLTQEFIQTLSDSLVMCVDSKHCYISGTVSAIENDGMPMTINDILYLPAEFVLKHFGAVTQWASDTQTLSAQWNNRSMTIGANQEHMVVDGENVPLSSTPVIENDVLLVPAEPLCQELDQAVEQEGSLVIIGSGLADVSKDVSADTKGMIMSSLTARLAVQNAWGAEPSKTYDDWAACTKSIVIDPTMAPWSSPKDQLAAVTGSLYVENISITPADQNTYDCTMDVYNYLGYTYGVVEVYGPDNRLLEVERIKPFGGLKTSVVSAVCDVGILMKDAYYSVKNWDLDYMNYKSSTNSEIALGVTVNVPVDGYVIITANPMHSERVAAFNMVHTLVEVMFATQDLKLGGDENKLKGLVKDYLLEQVCGNVALMQEMATEFQIFLSNIATENWADLPSFADVTCNALMDTVSRMEIDIWQIVREAVMEAGHTFADFVAEEFISKVLPYGDQVFSVWKICNNASNLICLFMDLESVCNAKSLMLETFEWKASYAKILREFPKNDIQGTLKFVTGYIDADMVPELMIIDVVAHYGNAMYMYTYQDRQIVPVRDPYGQEKFGLQNAMLNYVEGYGIMVRGDMSRGYVSEYYDQLQGAQFQNIYSFYDNESAVSNSAEASYRYNDRDVKRWFYKWMNEELKKKYESFTVHVNGFSLPEVTEENIKNQFGYSGD